MASTGAIVLIVIGFILIGLGAFGYIYGTKKVDDEKSSQGIHQIAKWGGIIALVLGIFLLIFGIVKALKKSPPQAMSVEPVRSVSYQQMQQQYENPYQQMPPQMSNPYQQQMPMANPYGSGPYAGNYPSMMTPVYQPQNFSF